MIDRGQRLDWFDSPEICLCSRRRRVAFWIFVGAQPDRARPFLDPRLLLDRNFAIGLVIAFFMGMLAFTSLVLFPSLLHDLRGYPDSAIGALLAARGIGNWLAFLVVVPFTGAFRRAVDRHAGWRRRPSPPCRWPSSTSIDELRRVLDECVAGLRLRLAFTPMTVLAFATLPAHQITEASASSRWCAISAPACTFR